MNITNLVAVHLDAYMGRSAQNSLYDDALLRRQIQERQDLQDRRNFEGHVTSSFALLDPTRSKVLMIHHKLFDMWMFPGGHYEGDVAPRTSALRELEEETGFPASLVEWVSADHSVAIDLDTHEIPARPSKDEDAHWHHDFLYLGVTQSHVDLVHQEEEVNGVRWVALDEAAKTSDQRLQRAIGKIVEILGETPRVL